MKKKLVQPISNMYYNLKGNSRSRGHREPNFTKKEFY